MSIDLNQISYTLFKNTNTLHRKSVKLQPLKLPEKKGKLIKSHA